MQVAGLLHENLFIPELPHNAHRTREYGDTCSAQPEQAVAVGNARAMVACKGIEGGVGAGRGGGVPSAGRGG